MNSTNVTYCDLKNFSKTFRDYSEYLVFLVCILGCIFNCLNICVLTRRQMKCPTNFILTSLAVADVLVMLEYMPFSYLQNKKTEYFNPYYYTYSFAVFIILHAIFTQSFHFISCCITIILALWRYIAVKFPQDNNKWCNASRTKWTIFLTYILCPYICIPLILTQEITPKDVYLDEDDKIYFKNNTKENLTKVTLYLVQYNDSIFKYISFYVYGLVIKLVPCILLTVLSYLLILELLRAKERRKKLMTPVVQEDGVRKKKVNQAHLEKEKQAYRTTKMLLAVLLLFLLVEFPQAIFGLLNTILGDKFEEQCYRPFGDLLDIFALTSSAINFILYCIMSQKFRKVFKEIFLPFLPDCKKQEWVSLQTVHTLVEL